MPDFSAAISNLQIPSPFVDSASLSRLSFASGNAHNHRQRNGKCECSCASRFIHSSKATSEPVHQHWSQSLSLAATPCGPLTCRPPATTQNGAEASSARSITKQTPRVRHVFAIAFLHRSRSSSVEKHADVKFDNPVVLPHRLRLLATASRPIFQAGTACEIRWNDPNRVSSDPLETTTCCGSESATVGILTSWNSPCFFGISTCFTGGGK